MKDIKDIKTTVVDTRYEKAIQFNYSIKEIFDYLGCKESEDFYTKLKESGIEIGHPIKASHKDVQDLRMLDYKSISEDNYEITDNALYNILINTIYYDVVFKDMNTGLYGLKDSNGELVVPAKFDEIDGASDIIFYQTLAKVRIDGQYYLTPRDGSGDIIGDSGYDNISRSYCFGWIERAGKKGLLNSITGEVLVPCEMDWIANEVIFDEFYFSKNGVFGFVVIDYLTHKVLNYQSPKYKTLKGAKSALIRWARKSETYQRCVARFLNKI